MSFTKGFLLFAALSLGFLAGCQPTAGPSVEETNKAVVLRYMQEVINDRSLDVLDEVMAEDWVAHNPAEQNGRENLKKYFAGMFAQYPEVYADVKRIAAEGNLVFVQSHYTGRKRDRGDDWAPGSGAVVDIFRLEDGVIVGALGRGTAPDSRKVGERQLDV